MDDLPKSSSDQNDEPPTPIDGDESSPMAPPTAQDQPTFSTQTAPSSSSIVKPLLLAGVIVFLVFGLAASVYVAQQNQENRPRAANQYACGSYCETGANCFANASTGAPVGCINHICQNTLCIGKTVPGRNCECSSLNACGHPCGASVGLCQDDSFCGFITQANQCVGAEGNTSLQFCLPNVPNQGYTTGQCIGIATSYLINPQGQAGGLTQVDIIKACTPVVPTPTPIPSPTPITQCGNLKFYRVSGDINTVASWTLLNSTDLAALQPGNSIYVATLGNTSGGAVVDKARIRANSSTWSGADETTNKKPKASTAEIDEYFITYTIPSTGVKDFRFGAEVHDTVTGRWY